MPNALETFTDHMGEIDRLLEIHGEIAGVGPGHKHKVEVLNKSAIVLITAFWEGFCEDLAAEALDHLVSHSGSADVLPKALRHGIAKELVASAHELAIWAVADGGWRQVVRDRMSAMTEERNKRLNTPKSNQIDDLFDSALGLKNLSSRWSWKGMPVAQARAKLNEYVTMRGAIAHRGEAEVSVLKDHVEKYRDHVVQLSSRTHEVVSKFVTDATGRLFNE